MRVKQNCQAGVACGVPEGVLEELPVSRFLSPPDSRLRINTLLV